MKRLAAGGGVAALLCAAAVSGYFFLWPKAATAPAEPERRETNRVEAAKKPADRAGVREGSRIVSGRGATGRVVRAASRATNRVVVAGDALPRSEDARKASAMRDLLDSGDERAALQAARELMASPEENVRSSVVTVLGWIGVKALPELTAMLADGEESVADDALIQWRMAFDEIEDETAKAELLVAAIGTLPKEEDMEALALSFSQLQDGLAIRSLSQIIQSGNEAAAAVARAQYEFQVGDPYTTAEAALAVAAQKDLEAAAQQ
jgi:hypothetical protein